MYFKFYRFHQTEKKTLQLTFALLGQFLFTKINFLRLYNFKQVLVKLVTTIVASENILSISI